MYGEPFKYFKIKKGGIVPTTNEPTYEVTDSMSSVDIARIIDRAIRDERVTTSTLETLGEAYHRTRRREVEESRWVEPIVHPGYGDIALGLWGYASTETRKERKQKQDSELDERFKHSTSISTDAKRLEVWRNKEGRTKKIIKMSIDELELAYAQLSAGYKCLGQKHKIYSVERVLNEKRGNTKLKMT